MRMPWQRRATGDLVLGLFIVGAAMPWWGPLGVLPALLAILTLARWKDQRPTPLQMTRAGLAAWAGGNGTMVTLLVGALAGWMAWLSAELLPWPHARALGFTLAAACYALTIVVFHRARLELTPTHLVVTGLTTRRIPWAGMLPGHPILAPPMNGLPALKMANNDGSYRWETVSTGYFDVDVDFFAWLVRYFVEHPADLGAIGSAAELRRLHSLFASSTAQAQQ